MYKESRIAGGELTALAVALLLAVGLVGTAFGSTAQAWRPEPICGSVPACEIPVYLAQGRQRPPPYFNNLSPEERARMQRRYREWEALPPEQRDTMRRRMEEWNRMPPQDRNRYQQRYQQWEQMSPQERRTLEENLQRWDSLSPQERDSIRRRFKN
jgi:hypothetical protein